MTRAEWRRDILKALIDKGTTMTKVAKDLGVSRAWIYQVLTGEGNPEWEARISEHLGIEGTIEEEEKNEK